MSDVLAIGDRCVVAFDEWFERERRTVRQHRFGRVVALYPDGRIAVTTDSGRTECAAAVDVERVG